METSSYDLYIRRGSIWPELAQTGKAKAGLVSSREEILSNNSTLELTRNETLSKWNPNLPNLPEFETEEKENLPEAKMLPKASKWNKILPEVQAVAASGRGSKGSISQPGIS